MNGSLKSRHRGQEHVMKFERLPSKTGQSESGEELHAVNHGKRDAAISKTNIAFSPPVVEPAISH